MTWMAVTADEFELPMAVCDSAKELAFKLGITHEAVRKNASRNGNGRNNGYKVIRFLEDDED